MVLKKLAAFFKFCFVCPLWHFSEMEKITLQIWRHPFNPQLASPGKVSHRLINVRRAIFLHSALDHGICRAIAYITHLVKKLLCPLGSHVIVTYWIIKF